MTQKGFAELLMTQTQIADISQTQQERLFHIDFKLRFLGTINRNDLVSRFGIKAASATRDLTQYKEIAPRNLEYDTKAKTYIQREGFKPLFSYPGNQALAALCHGLTTREIVPFALVDNGLRWHVRAHDRKRKAFNDFVVNRIARPKILNGEIPAEQTRDADIQWNRIVRMHIVPHPRLEHPETIGTARPSHRDTGQQQISNQIQGQSDTDDDRQK